MALLSRVICELRWASASLVTREDEAFIRTLLQSCPSWPRGHYQLACLAAYGKVGGGKEEQAAVIAASCRALTALGQAALAQCVARIAQEQRRA